MRKDVGILIGMLVLGGCASMELNSNTLDLASSTDDLMTEQVFHNLSNFVDSDLAYPTQLVIGSGTATTSDTLSANYTDPLSAALQTTSTLAAASLQATSALQTVVAPAGATTTTTNTAQRTIPLSGGVQSQYGRGSSSLGVGGSAVRSQLWSYVPVTDAFRAARLMALYHYVVYSSTYPDPAGQERYATFLKHDYPLINRSVNHNQNECLVDVYGNTVIAANTSFLAMAQAQGANAVADASLTATYASDAAKDFRDHQKAANTIFEALVRALPDGDPNGDDEAKAKAKAKADFEAKRLAAAKAAEDLVEATNEALKDGDKAAQARAVAEEILQRNSGAEAVAKAFAKAENDARVAFNAAKKAGVAATTAQTTANAVKSAAEQLKTNNPKIFDDAYQSASKAGVAVVSATVAADSKQQLYAAAAAAIAAKIEADAAAARAAKIEADAAAGKVPKAVADAAAARAAAAAAPGRAAAAMSFDSADYKKTPNLVSMPTFSRCLNGFSATGGGPTMTEGTYSFSSMQTDPYYLRGPNCVICTDPEQIDITSSKLRYGVNRNLSGGWLHWRALPGASPLRKPDNFEPGDTPLGIHGHYEFFAARNQEMKVPKFALFIMAAATQSDTGGGGSAGGGGGGGGGGGAGGGGGGTTGRAIPLIDQSGAVSFITN